MILNEFDVCEDLVVFDVPNEKKDDIELRVGSENGLRVCGHCVVLGVLDETTATFLV